MNLEKLKLWILDMEWKRNVYKRFIWWANLVLSLLYEVMSICQLIWRLNFETRLYKIRETSKIKVYDMITHMLKLMKLELDSIKVS